MSSPDTLTPVGAAVVLPPPPGDSLGSFSEWVYGVIPGRDEIVVGSVGYLPLGGIRTDLSGYSLDGSVIFQEPMKGLASSIFAVGTDTGLIGVASAETPYHAHEYQSADYVSVYDASGHLLSQTALAGAGQSNPASGVDTSDGFRVGWATGTFFGQPFYPMSQDFTADGQGGPVISGAFPFADANIGGTDFSIHDNQVQLAGAAATTLPGEPAHAVNFVTAAALAGGTKAAVAWDDSGTIYASVFDAATDSFGPVAGVTWGGGFANESLHLVALPDGGFALSWEVFNGSPQFVYQGEVFTADGTGGGILSLAGDVAGVDSHGELYTVALQAGQATVQTYAVNGGSPGGGGTGGQTFNSDDNGDVWTGTAGNETFNLGRGGDRVTGNGGNDTYKFAGVPWAGGHITDFNAGDVLDLTGLMSTTSDTGTDGFADGYLQITNGAGGAQVWADYHIPGNDGWWLVETLDGVSASSLTHSGDVISVGSSSGGGGGGGTPGPSAVTVTDATYAAPTSVNAITLAGSQQTVTANNAQDTTIWSNNTGNSLHGGTGDDTIHIGRGGDFVSGGAGRDVFVFDDIPWASATIDDLDANQGDSIDVSGILARAGYTGSDPVADGYLVIDNASNHDRVWANYHLPGNDAWWLVASVHDNTGTLPLGPLHYANGLISQVGEHVGGTLTIDNPPGNVSTAGYDTIVLLSSNYALIANNGGDTLIDQGSANQMFGGSGNDTFVLGTSTTEATDHWGGVNTWVLNPQSTVLTHSLDGLMSGDRLDVRQLLAASHYTGADPVGDGYVFVANPPPPSPGEMGDFVRSQLMYDPDGAAGPQAARALFDTYYTTPSQYHYADGFFVVQ